MLNFKKTMVAIICAAGMAAGTITPAAAVRDVQPVADGMDFEEYIIGSAISQASVGSDAAERSDAAVEPEAQQAEDASSVQGFFATSKDPAVQISISSLMEASENKASEDAAADKRTPPAGLDALDATASSKEEIPDESSKAEKPSVASESKTFVGTVLPSEPASFGNGTVPSEASGTTPARPEVPGLISESGTAQEPGTVQQLGTEQESTTGEESVTLQEPRLDDIELFVDWFYQCFLGRHAEPAGLEYWTSGLKSKTSTAAQVAAGIIFSEESILLNLSDSDFVAAMYESILHRSAKEDEIDTWVAVIDKAYTRKKIVSGFFGSDEFANNCKALGIEPGSFTSDDIADIYHPIAEFVARLYQVCLGRRYDKEGLDNWIRALVNGGGTGADVVWGFLDSDEYKAKKRSDADYIEDLYNTFLGRASDSEGKSNWLIVANMNFSRKYLAQGFVGSDEFGEFCDKAGIARGKLELEESRDIHSGITEMVNGLYSVLLQQKGKVPESAIEYWVNKTVESNNILDVVNDFFSSNEYKDRKTSNTQFVKDVYACMLFREPESSVLKANTAELNNGLTRDSYLQSIISSEEFSIICQTKGIPLIVDGWINGMFYVNGKGYNGWKTVDGYQRYFSNGVMLTDLDDVIGNTRNYVLKINRVACTVTAYAYNSNTKKYDIPAKVSVCTPGADATPTTEGTFYISDQYRWKELMGPCWGQWCSRFNGGMLFHSVYYSVSGDNTTLSVSAYNKLGQKGSHGCCRVPASMAYWIYYHCGSGTKVVVYDSSNPGPLGKPATIKLPSWHTWDPTDPTAYKYCKANGCH